MSNFRQIFDQYQSIRDFNERKNQEFDTLKVTDLEHSRFKKKLEVPFATAIPNKEDSKRIITSLDEIKTELTETRKMLQVIHQTQMRQQFQQDDHEGHSRTKSQDPWVDKTVKSFENEKRIEFKFKSTPNSGKKADCKFTGIHNKT